MHTEQHEARLDELQGFLLFLRGREHVRAEKLRIPPARFRLRSSGHPPDGIEIWTCVAGAEIASYVVSWSGVIHNVKGGELGTLQDPESWRGID